MARPASLGALGVMALVLLVAEPARCATSGPVPVPPSDPMSGPPSGPMEGPSSGPMSGPPSGQMSGAPSGPMSGPPSGPMSEPPSGPMSGPPSGPMEGPSSGPMSGPASGQMSGVPSGPMSGPPSGPMSGYPSGPIEGSSYGSNEGASSGPGSSSGNYTIVVEQTTSVSYIPAFIWSAMVGTWFYVAYIGSVIYSVFAWIFGSEEVERTLFDFSSNLKESTMRSTLEIQEFLAKEDHAETLDRTLTGLLDQLRSSA